MKKLTVLAVICICALNVSQAQEVGLRFGTNATSSLDNDDLAVSIDGMIPFGSSRLHANLYLNELFGLDIVWDFFNKPLGDVSGLTWYVGLGGSTAIENELFLLGAAGEFGLEYHFDFPLAVGFDYRPTFWIIDDETDLGFENYFGLNARYVIGK